MAAWERLSPKLITLLADSAPQLRSLEHWYPWQAPGNPASALPAEPTLRSTDVVGMSARYPGQTTGANGFWKTIMSATDLQRRIPYDRWDLESYYAVEIVPGAMAINAPFGAFCDNVGDFDAAAFRLSPTEAVTMDPQQRLLMEEAQGALMDAAPRIAGIAGSLTGGGHHSV